jgi:hypothetical protein
VARNDKKGLPQHCVARNDKKELLLLLRRLAITILVAITMMTPSQAAWFNGSWSSREKITVKASKVNGDLTEFPIYLNLADMPDSFFSTVNGTGADIRMTSSDEISETSFELVEIDTANGTGELWFKAPALSASTDTDFYIYYGNTSAVAYADTDPYGTHDVWSNGFVAVYHLNEDPTGGVGSIKDSTAFNNDANPTGAFLSSNLQNSQIGKGIYFEGNGNYIRIPNSASLENVQENDYSLSSWFYPSLKPTPPSSGAKGAYGIIIKNGYHEGLRYNISESFSLDHWLTGNIGVGNTSSANYAIKNFYKLNGIVQRSIGNTSIFTNGGNKQDRSFTPGTITREYGTESWRIGIARPAGSFEWFAHGIIDEVTLSSKPRNNSWISAEYQNQNSAGNFYLISNGQGAGFDQNLWSNYHRITIPAYILDEDLENFPVYVNLADLPASFFATVQANGADIRITKSDQDTQQAFELVDIDTANGTGELWFKAETLSATIDNEFYIWYGNTQAQAYSRTDEFGLENVWTEGYVGVWHMNQDPSQGQILDSTVYKNHGSGFGGINGQDLTSGQLGMSLRFDGNDDAISIPDSNELDIGQGANKELTVSTWYQAQGVSTTPQMILAKRQTDASFNTDYNFFTSANEILYGTGPSTDPNAWLRQTEPSRNDWKLIHGVLKATTTATGENSLFLNGEYSNGGAYTQKAIATTTPLNIGASSTGTNNFNYEGLIDETRISNKARSRAWVRAEYLNQKSTDKFYYIDNGNQIDNSQWSNNYKITIPASEVNGDLTDFPVYLNLADMPNDFFSTVNGTAADIRITESDLQTQTAFELVELDIVNGSGELWFKANLSSSVDNIFYLHAGNTTAEAYADDHLFGAQNVWSNGFAAVYHMNENPTGLIKDSTKYANDGTSVGAMTSSDSVSGQLGRSISLDGVDDAIDLNNSPSLNITGNEITLSAWLNHENTAHNPIFHRDLQYATNIDPLNRHAWADSSNWSYASFGYTVTAIENEWFYYTAVKSNPNVKILENATAIRDQSFGANITSTNSDTYLGCYASSSGGTVCNGIHYYQGEMDEARIANIARTQDWITTEYKNQKSPGNFYLVENGNVAGFDPNLWSNNHKITIPASIVNGDLENFPVYINLSDLPINFFGSIQANGEDLRVTKADQKTQLAFELVDVDTINKTGELWFKADTLSSSIDNVFYLWFGNPNAQAYDRADEFGTENVWTEDFTAVYHLGENGNTLDNGYLDSTKNRNHGNGISMTSSSDVEGKFGKSQTFDSSFDYIQLANEENFDFADTTFTISSWLRTNESGNTNAIIAKRAVGTGWMLNTNPIGRPNVLIKDGSNFNDAGAASTAVNDGSWRYVSTLITTDTVNSANQEILFYTDGNIDSSGISPTFTYGPNNNQVTIGRRDTGGDFYGGELDELHISWSSRTADWIKTEYLNQKDTGVFYTVDNGDLNSTAWSNLFKITILASQVNGDLTDFPVYVNLSDLPNDFFSVVNGSGTDIRMSLADQKTQTAFELVSLDTANGQGELWFKAPFLSGSTDTEFYLLAGNPNADAYAEDHIFGAQNVWSNGFVAVYHMNEDPSGTVLDSTKYNNDGLANGAMTSGDLVSGQLGNAIDFDGTNDFINFGSSEITNITDDLYVSAWIRTEGYGTFKGIVTRQTSTPYNGGWGLVERIGTLSNINFNGTSFAYYDVDSNPPIFTWSKFAFQTEMGSRRAILNGSPQTASGTLLPTPSPSSLLAGRFYTNVDNYYFNGLIDEINISNKARNLDWIKTEYNNQNSPSTFYTTEKVERGNAIMFGRMF